jgi:hypothetical protein
MEPATHPSTVGERRIIRWLLELDRVVDGRRSRLLIGAAIVQAVLAPAFDRAIATLVDNALLGAAARDLGSVSFAGFSAVSLLSSVLLLVLASVVVAGRAAVFATSRDASAIRSIWQEARSIVHAEWAILQRKGLAEAMLTLGGVSYIALAALRDVLRIFRFATWKGPISWFDLENTAIATPLVWVYNVENVVEVAIVLSATAALCGVVAWVSRPVRPVQGSQIRTARMASSLPPVVDVQDEATISRVAGSFHGDMVGRVMRSLGQWQAESPIEDEADLHRRLRYHFISAGFTVGSEVWMGRVGRVDLVLDETVAVELKFGALRATERNRVMGQSTTYANYWTGRGPIIVVCVDAPEARLTEVSQSVIAWNRALSDKEHNGSLPAPIIVLHQVGSSARISAKGANS